MILPEGDSYTCARPELVARKVERLFDLIEHGRGGQRCIGLPINTIQDDGELVDAKPREPRPDRGREVQSPGNFNEELVTNSVPERVVLYFSSIFIDEK